jgi:calcineurin-like phosphoesterase
VKILFFGDVVGHEATRVLVERLAELHVEHSPDVVVVNAENCAPDGLGMGAKEIDMLLTGGVDVISGGNHSWDDPESIELLGHPRVIRPANVAPGVPGRGSVTVHTAGGSVTVLNLVDPRAMHSVRATEGKVGQPFDSWAEADRVGTVIVDFHGDHVFDKQVFAHAVDGQAAAVLGTHSHEATSRLHRLPGGTALGRGDGRDRVSRQPRLASAARSVVLLSPTLCGGRHRSAGACHGPTALRCL